jgi:hypothetical protein
MRQLPLSASAQTVLDGVGNGTASTGPLAPGETWLAGLNASVRTQETAVTSEALCRVYCGGRFIGGTTWGSTGDATSDTPQLGTGQQVTAEWTGGDAGATAVLDITGTKTVG